MSKSIAEEKIGSRNSWAGVLAKILLSIGLVAFVFYKAGFAQTVMKLKTASPLWITLALLVYLGGTFVRAYRWQGLLETLGLKYSIGRLSWLYFIGFFFNQLVPTGIGGDAMKTYMLAKEGAGGALAVNSVLIDRATGLYSLLVMGTMVLIVRPGYASREVTILLVGLTVGITIGAALFIWGSKWIDLERLPSFARNRFLKAFNKFYASFGHYNWQSIGKALLVSVFFNLLLIISTIFIAKAFGVDISVWYYFVFVPLISASLILPSINGVGTRELAYVILFGQVGVSEPVALSMSLSVVGLNIFMALIGGMLLVVQSLQRTSE